MGEYAYASARVSAMRGKMFRRERLERLIEARKLGEIIGVLEGTPYSPYVAKLKEITAPGLEGAFQENLVDTYATVVDLVPEEMQDIFQSIFKKFDVRNLKTVLISKHAGIPQAQISEMFVPTAFLSPSLLEEMIRAEDIPDAVRKLEGTEYWGALNEVLSEFEERKNLLSLLHALDRHFYEELWRKITYSRARHIEVMEALVGMQIDAVNIKITLRCKADRVPVDDILKHIIPCYFAIDESVVRRMAEATDVAAALGPLEGTDYAGPLKSAMPEYEETKSLLAFERALDELLLKRARTFSLGRYYLGVGPIVAFLIEKDVEVRNLVAVVNGKVEDLRREEIERCLIKGD
jgi:V/A-type H+-transporting ATPase subunit C